MSVNVRVSGALREHVERTTTQGDYENVSEYIRDLIRRDKAERERVAFEAVKAQLLAAFAASDSDFEEVSAEDIRALASDRLRR
ncbi:addiction module antitoxin [Algihabitans albus]|uniref:ribbon-helix-helix domain-containing protein n=1 Tax=Algihabitans albus TaxID=2164067 RepID=UPI0035CF7A8D